MIRFKKQLINPSDPPKGVVTPGWASGPAGGRITKRKKKISYRMPFPARDHSPSNVIWLYLRFSLSLRDVEDLLAERGLAVSYETVRGWVASRR
jgi:hypothetical protein